MKALFVRLLNGVVCLFALNAGSFGYSKKLQVNLPLIGAVLMRPVVIAIAAAARVPCSFVCLCVCCCWFSGMLLSLILTNSACHIVNASFSYEISLVAKMSLQLTVINFPYISLTYRKYCRLIFNCFNCCFRFKLILILGFNFFSMFFILQ